MKSDSLRLLASKASVTPMSLNTGSRLACFISFAVTTKAAVGAGHALNLIRAFRAS